MERLRELGGEVCTEAAQEIEDLEERLELIENRANRFEEEAAEADLLRARLAEAEAARLCGACAFGTQAAAHAFCTACGRPR